MDLCKIMSDLGENRPQSSGMKRNNESGNNRESKIARLKLNSHVLIDNNIEENDPVPDNLVNSGKDIYYYIDKETGFKGNVETYRIMLHPAVQSNTTLPHIFDYVRRDILNIVQEKLNVSKEADRFQVTMGISGRAEHEMFMDVKATKILNFYSDAKVWLAELEAEIQRIFNNSNGNVDYNEFHYISLDFFKYDFMDSRLDKSIEGVEYIDCPAADSFQLSVLAGMNPDAEPIEEILGEYSDAINMDGISLPVQISSIPRIESQNNFSINVFTKNNRDQLKGPVYHTKNRKDIHINLLYNMTKSVIKISGYRYNLIRNLGIAANKWGEKICDGCLNCFDTDDNLARHRDRDCLRAETELSNKSTKFTNTKHQTRHPVVVYADFEALLKPISQNEQPLNNGYHTTVIKQHIPFGYAYYVKFAESEDPILESYIDYNGNNDCMSHFFKSLKLNLSNIYKKHKNNINFFIPIFIHNLTNYDGHFIMREIGKHFTSVRVLGSLNSYFAIYANDYDANDNDLKLRFLDSYKFLSEKLETLVSDQDTNKLSEIRRLCNNDQEGFELLRHKGIIPFDYIQSFDDLSKNSLPKRAYFYNQLNDYAISQENYRRALRTWEHFKCRTIADYIELYVKTDVLLLADVFENLRKLSLRYYELDPVYYYSLSGLSWDAMLYKTSIVLDAQIDVDMLLFIEHSIRGGVAHCSKMHAIANNEHMGRYNENDDSSYIMYYDANNLYGYAMTLPLPYEGFKWINTDNINVEDYYKIPDESREGYILEVDLAYPAKLHDLHADFPFCPEKKSLPHSRDHKLNVTDLAAKKNYVIHHSHLSLCIQNGLVVEKVHRILKFKQKRWLKCYIDLNNTLRMEAKIKSEQNFFKLMNNSIYGKSIENTKTYSNIDLLKHDSNPMIDPEYQGHTICSEEMIAIRRKPSLKFNKPKYIGFCILELAKTYMYRFHYSVMKKKFQNRIKLLYTDTDSLIYQIKSKNFFDELRPLLDQYFDTGDYDASNEFNFPLVNHKELGLFKDEVKGKLIKEFVALKPKMYALELDNGQDIKKATGVLKYITDRFTIEDYKKCLYSGEANVVDYYQIINIGHAVYTARVKKKGLKSTYRHRYVLNNKVDTLPWFHYGIPSDAYNIQD